jgi:hypothetical protein
MSFRTSTDTGKVRQAIASVIGNETLARTTMIWNDLHEATPTRRLKVAGWWFDGLLKENFCALERELRKLFDQRFIRALINNRGSLLIYLSNEKTVVHDWRVQYRDVQHNKPFGRSIGVCSIARW